MARYLVVIELGPMSWGARAPDLPGCIAVAESRQEALRLIRQAIEFHLEGLKQAGQPVPSPISDVEFVEVEVA